MLQYETAGTNVLRHDDFPELTTGLTTLNKDVMNPTADPFAANGQSYTTQIVYTISGYT